MSAIRRLVSRKPAVRRSSPSSVSSFASGLIRVGSRVYPTSFLGVSGDTSTPPVPGLSSAPRPASSSTLSVIEILDFGPSKLTCRLPAGNLNG
jgi:hypothetical protein